MKWEIRKVFSCQSSKSVPNLKGVTWFLRARNRLESEGSTTQAMSSAQPSTRLSTRLPFTQLPPYLPIHSPISPLTHPPTFHQPSVHLHTHSFNKYLLTPYSMPGPVLCRDLVFLNLVTPVCVCGGGGARQERKQQQWDSPHW